MTRAPHRAHFATRRRYLAALASEALAPLLTLAARARARGPAAPPREWRRGLIISHTHIGDVLYRTASLPALARALPDCAWDMLAAPTSAAVLAGNPHLSSVLPIAPGEGSLALAPGGFARLRAARYDVVLCTNSIGHQADFVLAAALGAPARVGFPYKGLSGLINIGVEIPYPAPWAAYVRAMVAAVCDVPPEWSLRPQVFPSEDDEAAALRLWHEVDGASGAPVVATAITSRQVTAAWPASHWAAAMRPVAAAPAMVLLCGAPSDRPLLERAARMADFPVRVVAGELGLAALAAFFRHCTAFVGTDSGLRHVANAAGIPTLFFRNLASHPIETGPYCDTETDLLAGADVDGVRSVEEALSRSVPAERVADAVLRAISVRSAGTGSVVVSATGPSRGPKTWLIERLPAREQVRLRYWYRRLRGRLDPELRIALRLPLRGRTVIDVGANTGVYTAAFARAGARVEAFEPLPGCADVLEGFTGARVRLHRVALSGAAGAAPLYVPVDDGVLVTGRASFTRPEGAHMVHEVRVATLDEFDFRDVALVKVDVEGHELDVLAGARETLGRERPVLLVEIEARHLGYAVGEAFARIGEHGYEGHFWDGARLRAIAEFDPARHQRLGLDGELPATGYVNNFLFLHADDAASLARLRGRRP